MLRNPFLTYVTRTCRRPASLRRAISSLSGQSDKDFNQVFLVDNTGKHKEGNLLWANKQFDRHKKAVDGEYVFILDDSCVIINDDMIKKLKACCDEFFDPDIILVRSLALAKGGGHHHLPIDAVWGENWEKGESTKKWGGNEQCYVVKNWVWKELVHSFAMPRGGDWFFGKALLDSGLYIVKLNEVFGKGIFRGMGTKFEKCDHDWFVKISIEHGIENLYDNVWALDHRGAQ